VSRSGAPPESQQVRAGSDQLTLIMASLIISVWFESADARDRNHTHIAFARYGGQSGSVKTYHGRKCEEQAPPSWTRW
jgi:hypothetical protein